MPISKNCNFGGVAVSYFRVISARVNIDTLTAQVAIAGWHDETAFLSGSNSTWGTMVTVPLAQLADLDALMLSVVELGGGTVLLPADGTLTTAKTRQWALIKSERQARDESPITVDDFELDADSSSRMDIMGAIMAMQLTGETTRTWRCADNVMRELTMTQIVSAGTSIAARRQALIETSDVLYQQIQAATTPEEVSAVVWPAGPNLASG